MKRREFFVKSASATAATMWLPLVNSDRAIARADTADGRAAGPLRVHPDNRRYFTDGSGRAIYLTGSHVWNNLVDMGPGDPPPKFDFDAYLDSFEKYRHNFIRLWAWEHTTWDTSANGRWGKKDPHIVAPNPWMRTGRTRRSTASPSSF